MEDIKWDFAHLVRLAPGSDLWPITWADDDKLYTSWGDGGGFGGTNENGRVSLGVARIAGSPEQFITANIFGGAHALAPATFVGKSNGILSLGGVLYMHVVEQDRWLRAKIGRSTDHGKTWQFQGVSFSRAEWDFEESDGAFSDLTFLNFGTDYQGARDDYVYAYSQDKRAHADRNWITSGVALLRVHKDHLLEPGHYEYFAGLDTNTNPVWTKDIRQPKPVFTDSNGVGWGVRVTYNPALRRYFLSAFHSWDGSWGLFDAPEPWGPWTTVAYYDQWIDSQPKFGFTLPQKWMGADGTTLYMVFSGTGIYDSFNLIKATLTLRH